MDNYEDNVVVDIAAIKAAVDEEKPISKQQMYNMIFSRCTDCNMHCKVSFKNAQPDVKTLDGITRIFVPSSATTLLPLISELPASTKFEIDIRSLDVKGEVAMDIFKPFLAEFSCKVRNGKYVDMCKLDRSLENKEFTAKLVPQSCDEIFMNVTSPYISSMPIKSPVRGRFHASDVTIIVDRRTLMQCDSYCAMIYAYFFKHFKVVGTPHPMHKYVFRPMTFSKPTRIEISVAILQLDY